MYTYVFGLLEGRLVGDEGFTFVALKGDVHVIFSVENFRSSIASRSSLRLSHLTVALPLIITEGADRRGHKRLG
jgi:hypothetical protein